MLKSLKYLPLVVLFLAACRDKNGDDSAPPACDAATANAGEDQTVPLGSTVTVDGVNSAPCQGVTYLYTWAFESVPVDSSMDASLFTNNNSSETTSTQFTPDVAGTYVVSLVLTDPEGATTSAPDLVIVEVTSDNMPPLADCGEDQTVAVGDRVALDGSGSHDPEGVAVTFQWALSTVPEESALGSEDIYNSGGPSATVIPDVPGVYLVSLIVSDGTQWSEPDYCTVTATTDNQPPVADAGTGGILPPCTEEYIELDGYGSYDPEGATITYLWSLISAPSGSKTSDKSFDDRTSPAPRFMWDVSGTYSFQLLVNDGESDSAPDVVTYTVEDRSLNNAPVANAGDDQSISATSDCTSSAYVWTCDDCPSETVELDGTASSDEDGDDVHYAWTDTSGELLLATPYAAYTLATTPAVAATVNTTTTYTWTVSLDVSDCEASDSDEVVISYACTGER